MIPSQEANRQPASGRKRRFIFAMKKIITPAVREEAEYICDVTGKPAVAKLAMRFGYGSSRDMDELEVDLCDEVAEEVLKLLQNRYPQFRTQEVDHSHPCPMCGRAWPN